MCKLLIFLILLLVRTINCRDKLNWHPLVPEYIDLMFLFSALLMGAIIRQLIIRFNIPTPYCTFAFLGSALWGIFACNNDVALLASNVINMDPREILFIYLPILVFNISFCVDSGAFFKTLPQIAILGIPVTLCTSGFFGVMIRFAIDPLWRIRRGVLFGIFSCAIYPANIVYLLKMQSSRTKQIASLLEGEALFGVIIADMTHSLILGNVTGFVTQWYQFVCLLLRFVILGLLAGYFFGLLGSYLLRKMYINQTSLFVLCFGMPFFVYSWSQVYISGCGTISVVVTGLMMGAERACLSKEINKFILRAWKVIGFVMDVVMCVITTTIGVVYFSEKLNYTDYILTVVTYLMYYAIRFICFLIFLPMINRLGYGLDLKSMILCVWCGVKCPFSLVLLDVFIDVIRIHHKNPKIYFHIMMLYFFSNLINGSSTKMIMDFLGLRRVSVAKQINMNKCIKHIFEKREKAIAILKMDRFLSDANWAMVTEATNIRHPYQIELEMENENVFFWGFDVNYCPDCKMEIKHEPTSKELNDITRDAKMRVLKTRKMVYMRKFEHGMISKEAIRILSQAVEIAMETDEAVVEVENLQKRFTKEDFINRCIGHRALELKKTKGFTLKPPRKYFRRLYYNIVLNKNWEKGMLVVVSLHTMLIIVDTFYRHWLLEGIYIPRNKVSDYLILLAKCTFCSIYILEFIMKIMAYSWIHVCKHGFRTYFRSLWNIMDFIMIIVIILNALYDASDMHHDSNKNMTMLQTLGMLEWFRVIRLFRILKIFYPKVIQYLDRKSTLNMALTFELGNSYANGETEILEMLPYMIHDDKILEKIKQKIENDRTHIFQLLATVQKNKPWLAITVKTKLAIRTVLKSMNDAISQLRTAGWVDEFERDKLEAEMEKLYKKVNAIKRVQPSAPKVIFKEVAWMREDSEVIDFLFKNVTVRKFEPGDVVFKEGTIADGIYIVVTGLFTSTYTPDKQILENLHKFGHLPVVDYLPSINFEEAGFEHTVSGNCIGELSIMTNRPYNCSITADVHSQVYVLNDNVIKNAMELSPNSVSGLECRIWKEIAMRIGLPLLMSVPSYRNFSQDQIKYTLERAFVPNLRQFKIFAVTELIQDILVIEGLVADYNTKETFIAPCHIPRTVQKLILPTSSLMNIPIHVEAKLLIIPEKDLDYYDIMMSAGEIGEMVAVGSATKCLQHMAQDRIKQRRRARMKIVATREGSKKKFSTAPLNIDTSSESQTSKVSSPVKITAGSKLPK